MYYNVIMARGSHLEELPVGNVSVVVHVVDAEREPQLGQLVALHAELRHALDELLEVHLKQQCHQIDGQ